MQGPSAADKHRHTKAARGIRTKRSYYHYITLGVFFLQCSPFCHVWPCFFFSEAPIKKLKGFRRPAGYLWVTVLKFGKLMMNQEHLLWALKRTVSMRLFLSTQKYVLIDG